MRVVQERQQVPFYAGIADAPERAQYQRLDFGIIDLVQLVDQLRHEIAIVGIFEQAEQIA